MRGRRRSSSHPLPGLSNPRHSPPETTHIPPFKKNSTRKQHYSWLSRPAPRSRPARRGRRPPAWSAPRGGTAPASSSCCPAARCVRGYSWVGCGGGDREAMCGSAGCGAACAHQPTPTPTPNTHTHTPQQRHPGNPPIKDLGPPLRELREGQVHEPGPGDVRGGNLVRLAHVDELVLWWLGVWSRCVNKGGG